VGVDFTPYESCGSWVWTDWGWTFVCDWDWGWLPFHYGNWGWFDDYWAWVPDYTWTPAAVDWRGGGGYVGWRPTAPSIRDHRSHHFVPSIRDHRGEGPVIRDHRHPRSYDSHWRFASESDFGKPHIRAHLFKSPAEGLRVTELQPRPTLRGRVQAIRAASLMRTRFANARSHTRVGSRFGQTRPSRPTRPARGFDRGRPPVYDRNPARARAYDRAFSSSRPSVYQPGYTRPARPYTPSTSHGRMPAPQPGTVRTDPRRPPAWQGRDIPQAPVTISPSPPDRPRWHPPASGTPSWTRPSSPPPRTWAPPRPSSSTPTWTRPSSPPPPRASSSSSWSPSHSSHSSAPSRSYSPPARSSAPSHSAPSRSSAPARSSGSFGRRR
jgi:hypothetical protein